MLPFSVLLSMLPSALLSMLPRFGHVGRVLLSCLPVLCLGAGVCRAELTPDQVTRGKRATALVELKNAHRTGSAFCIDAGGFFLTNEHVVADIAPGEKISVVLNSGEPDQQILRATVVRADKKADLALLRVQADKPLPLLELGSVDGLLETASLTAFGYPFGTDLAEKKNDYPNITVSTGHVTALRKHNGILEHIQLDASVNPGSSGGPVVDSRGLVVGVVQAGIPGSGVNLAIPASRVSAFLEKPEITLASPDPKTLATLLHTPHDYVIHVARFRKTADVLTVTLIVNPDTPNARTYRAQHTGGDTYTIVHATLAPTPAAGRMLHVTAQSQTGSVDCYVADAPVKAGGKTLSLSAIQRIESDGAGKITLADGTELTGRVTGLESVEAHFGGITQPLNLGRFATLLVEDSAAQSQSSVTYRIEARQGNGVVADASGSLSASGVTRSDERAVASITDRQPVSGEAGRVPGRPAVPIAPAHKTLVTPRAVIAPPALPSDKVIVTLPAEVENVAFGGGGRYMILHLPRLHKLAIFDINAAKITRYISLGSDDIFFAAGNEKLIVTLNDQNIIQRWSLLTGERELNVPLPDAASLRAIALGAASDGPLLMLPRQGEASYLDIATLSRLDVEFPHGGFSGNHPSYPYRIWAAGDGTVFTGCSPDLSPSGLAYMMLRGSKSEPRTGWDSCGYVVPNLDGSLVCTSRGIYNAELRQIDPDHFKNVECLPAFDSLYFVGVFAQNGDAYKKATLGVYSAADRRLLVTLPPFEEMDTPDQWARGKMTLDKCILFAPAANLLVTLADDHSRLVLRRLNILDALEKAGIDYLFVASLPERHAVRGKRYTYQLAVKSKRGGVRYTLDSAPKGMTLSKTGRLEWQTPADAAAQESILVTVRDSSGQEVFHSFVISID